MMTKAVSFLFIDTYIRKVLRCLPNDQLQILRNTIYAKHGYVFQSEDLKTHFSKVPWYNPNSSFNETMLTENERELIELFLLEEKKETNVTQKVLDKVLFLFPCLCYRSTNDIP